MRMLRYVIAIAFLSHGAFAQRALPVEPQSSITVLVDLSETWLNTKSEAANRRILGIVSQAIATLSDDLDAPIAIQYLAIGDKSLGRLPLCEAVYAPNILSVRNSQNDVVDVQDLIDLTSKDCPRVIFKHTPESHTDIAGALDSVSRSVLYDHSGYHALIILSDFQQDRRKGQQGQFGSLKGMHCLLLYRVLDQDTLNSAGLDKRLGIWKSALSAAGASVYTLDDVSPNAASLARLLQR